MSTGAVTVLAPVNCGTAAGYGQLQALYVSPSTYSNHPTKWKYNSSAWYNVGGAAVQVMAGVYTVTFDAINSGDTNPPTQIVNVPSQKLVKMNVSYSG